MKTKHFQRAAGLLLLLLVLAAVLGVLPAQALDRPTRQRIMKAVVQIVAADRDGKRLTPKWSGSGTIVSPDGLILTNCHVAFPRAMWDDPQFDRDVLIVSLTIRSDQPPQPTYLAEVVQYDPQLDLAVIRVTHTLDGNQVNVGTLNLPTVALGDSDELEIGDPITIFGYPGIGGETITLTSGDVSGFTLERGITGRAWIKTDATIAGGNSGGTAVDENGLLIGVPTQGGAGAADRIVDCRYVADTNGDGKIDEHDTCVPMGGFINALRPVNLAKPLIDAAVRGLGPQPTPSPQPSPAPSGPARVSRLFFAPGVNSYDQPTTVVESFPSGTEAIYLFFDYSNFQDGTSWHPVLVYNGQRYEDTWPASTWSGGPSGNWWISISDEPLADGTYEFQLYYGGEKLASKSVKVGGPALKTPAFLNLLPQDEAGNESFLPTGVKKIIARFDYQNMTASTRWSYRLYQDGRTVETKDGTSLQGSGRSSLILERPGGFAAGNYRLELYIGTRLAATADFTVAGNVSGQVFGPITFARGKDRQDNPLNPGTTFPSGISELYAFFDYQGMQDGWEWTRRWSIDGEVVVDSTGIWTSGASGKNFWVRIYSQDALPDGEYRLELLVRGSPVQSASCLVGSPAAPTPTPVPAKQGLEVYGTIADADTGRGIPGAAFIVLKPGITVDAFQWTDEEVYTWAKSDRNGAYELPKPLVRGETYSIIVAAQGYRPLAEDGVRISTDPKAVPSPFELNIRLQRAK